MQASFASARCVFRDESVMSPASLLKLTGKAKYLLISLTKHFMHCVLQKPNVGPKTLIQIHKTFINAIKSGLENEANETWGRGE